MTEPINETERYWVPSGTIVHIAGFPVQVTEHTAFLTHKANWALIKEAITFPPEGPLVGEAKV